MYKDEYQREFFGEVIVGATQELMNHIWGSTKRERIDGCKAWIAAVSTALGVVAPEFEFIEGNDGIRLYNECGGGLYNGEFPPANPENPVPSTGKIYMFKKFSLTTLLHEYRHHLQRVQNIGAPVVAGDGFLSAVAPSNEVQEAFDAEDDAREWSCSLYFVADPDRYMRAYTAGKLRYA